MSVNRPSRGRMRADLIVAQRYNLAVGWNRLFKTYQIIYKVYNQLFLFDMFDMLL